MKDLDSARLTKCSSHSHEGEAPNVHLVVWEYDVPEEHTQTFETMYGDGGPWERLFSESAAYEGTSLLKKTGSAGGYLTVDFWQTADEYEAFLASVRSQYQTIDRECEMLTTAERCLGRFDLQQP